MTRHLVITALCLIAVTGTTSGRQRTTSARSGADAPVIDGLVTDRAGQPLPGVSVDAVPEGGGRAMHATTDRSGAYHLEGLSEGTYRIDFSLGGFVGIRRNHVRPVVSGGPVRADVVLSVRPVCECVANGLAPGPVAILGQVVDDAGRPLPHARLGFAGPRHQETAYADGEGRFQVRPPAEGRWSIVVSHSGFAPATRQISTATPAPVVFRLSFVGTRDLPEQEVFNDACSCPEYFVVEER